MFPNMYPTYKKCVCMHVRTRVPATRRVLCWITLTTVALCPRYEVRPGVACPSPYEAHEAAAEGRPTVESDDELGWARQTYRIAYKVRRCCTWPPDEPRSRLRF